MRLMKMASLSPVAAELMLSCCGVDLRVVFWSGEVFPVGIHETSRTRRGAGASGAGRKFEIICFATGKIRFERL